MKLKCKLLKRKGRDSLLSNPILLPWPHTECSVWAEGAECPKSRRGHDLLAFALQMEDFCI